MWFTAALRLLQGVWLTITCAFIPTLKDVWKQPSLLLHPITLSRIYMSHVWIPFGDGIDENARNSKQRLITPYATGVVLDVGAGEFAQLLSMPYLSF
jgi:hypothetical protein